MRAPLRQFISAVVALCPALAAAQGAYQTFTDRAALRETLADRSNALTVVNLKSPSVTATDLGIARVGTAGACMAAPSFVVDGPAKWLDFANGSCGDGSLTFTLTRGDIGAFGFVLQPVSIPDGSATFDVTATFDGGVAGTRTTSYALGRGLADGYFGLFLNPDWVSSDAARLATVTLSTNNAVRLAIRDVEFAGMVAPEPATVTLLGAGLLALGAAVRRRRAHG